MTQELQQPAFSRESIEMLDAMGLGPVWLLRDSMDPLVPTGALRPARLPQLLRLYPRQMHSRRSA